MFQYPSQKSISVFGDRDNIASYEDRKTSPNILMFGGDENYLLLMGSRWRPGVI
ncbi:MAG: hypothetical protein WDO16_22245 [Bacteroidota bacterium]